MDEFNFDILGFNPAELKFIQSLIDKSIDNGVQVGVPWTEDVYKYIFESDANLELASLLNMNVEIAEIVQENF